MYRNRSSAFYSLFNELKTNALLSIFILLHKKKNIKRIRSKNMVFNVQNLHNFYE